MAPLDLVLVVSDRNRGWVLETIADEIARHHPGRTEISYRSSGFPRSRAYFFSHYSLFQAAIRRDPRQRFRRNLVFFTHPSFRPDEAGRVARQLNRAAAVLSMSSVHAEALVAAGVDRSKMHVVVAGTDPERFTGHQRGGGVVGFCSSFYPRKEPERIAGIVEAMPSQRFVLVGRGWRDWGGFDGLEQRPNFEYREPEYTDYPAHYAAMDVFVSPSRLEGGPIPLLEAMMSNVVPVCSRTGFGPDLIEHGRNGFLFDVDAPVAEICSLVERASIVTADVRATIVSRTWARFSAEVQAVAERRTPSAAGRPA